MFTIWKLAYRIKQKARQARCAPHLILLVIKVRLQLRDLQRMEHAAEIQNNKDMAECERRLKELSLKQ